MGMDISTKLVTVAAATGFAGLVHRRLANHHTDNP